AYSHHGRGAYRCRVRGSRMPWQYRDHSYNNYDDDNDHDDGVGSVDRRELWRHTSGGRDEAVLVHRRHIWDRQHHVDGSERQLRAVDGAAAAWPGNTGRHRVHGDGANPG